MPRSRLLVAFLALPFTSVACADILGIGDVPLPDGAATDSSDAAPDVGIDVTEELPVFDASGCDACADVVPAGWTPVLASTTKTSCPSGWGGLDTRPTDPVVGQFACSCNPSNQVSPTCTSGSTSVTNGASCGGGTTPITVNGNTCMTFGPVTLQASEVVPPVTASGGSCTATATANQAALSTTTIALCTPLGCPIDLCTNQPPSGFSACLEQIGDLSCPGDFPTKHVVSDAFQVDCTGQCTTCDASATCTGPAITFYDDCTSKGFVTAINADGKCNITGVGGAVVAGATYGAGTINPTYTADGPKKGAAMPVGTKRTLCCK